MAAKTPPQPLYNGGVFPPNRAAMKQADLFDSDPQTDLFAEEGPRLVYRADPTKIRNELNRILGEMRDAKHMPWDLRRQRYYRTVGPQMSLWLPEDEAAQLRFDFECEMRRLEAA